MKVEIIVFNVKVNIFWWYVDLKFQRILSFLMSQAII